MASTLQRFGVLLPLAFVAAALTPAATAQTQPLPAAAPTALRQNQALVMVDYQVLKVKNDQPIDLLGFHVYNQVADGLFVGAGMSAPLVRGAYGGFATFDVGAHGRVRLGGPLFATAGVAVGGGAGGRNVENAKTLAGSGGFTKAYAGLGYDFGGFAIGAQATRMKFNRAAVGGTQANVFLELPYSTLTGPFNSHNQRVPAADAQLAAASGRESMLTVIFDNYRQQDPEGSNKSDFNIVDLQYSQFFARDRYWFVNLGVGYKGLPLSNQLLGGVGQRLQLSPRVALYGQLGIGSGIYAPEVINTDSGLLVYPKLAAEFAVTKDLGLALSAGYLVAPKGSSKNAAVGIALTRHLRLGGGSNSSELPAYQAFRLSVIQQTDVDVRYRDQDRGQVRMVGLQADALIDQNWYIPLQGAAAYSTYLGYPGYGELLAGIGLQTTLHRGGRWQGFGQVMAGTNVHGLAVKGSAGIRYVLNDSLAVNVNAGRIVARSEAGNRFVAGSVGLGLDYCFSIARW